MSANRIRDLGAVGLVVTVGLAASSGAASVPAIGSRQATDSVQASSKIAFIIGSSLPTSKRGPQTPGIYVMNADGSGKRLLARSTSHLYAWSPDGRKIAFGRRRNGSDDIFVMSADGSGQRNLTRTRNVLNQGAVWSPDGRKIAYMRNAGGGASGIYVMNADGSGKRRLTPNPANLPDLVARRAENRLLRGTHLRHERRREREAAPDAQGVASLASWSPDGRKIAFTGGDGDVYAINADGSGRRNLTRKPVDYGADEGPAPAWSPDGQKIAFDRGRGRGIFVMNADGSGQRRLTHFGRQTRWSPDGRMIAFRAPAPATSTSTS